MFAKSNGALLLDNAILHLGTALPALDVEIRAASPLRGHTMTAASFHHRFYLYSPSDHLFRMARRVLRKTLHHHDRPDPRQVILALQGLKHSDFNRNVPVTFNAHHLPLFSLYGELITKPEVQSPTREATGESTNRSTEH